MVFVETRSGPLAQLGFILPDAADALRKDPLYIGRVFRLRRVAESPREDGYLGAQPIVFGDDVAPGDEAAVECGNAAEAEESSCLPQFGRDFIHLSVGQQFEEELQSVVQVQVVKSDMEFIYSVKRQHLVERLLGADGFQQQHRTRPSAHVVDEPPRLVGRSPHGQHHDVGPAADNFVYLFAAAVVQRITANQQSGPLHLFLHGVDVRQRVVRLHGVYVSLAFSLSPRFEVYEYSVHPVPVGNPCHLRGVGDVHQSQCHVLFFII